MQHPHCSLFYILLKYYFIYWYNPKRITIPTLHLGDRLEVRCIVHRQLVDMRLKIRDVFLALDTFFLTSYDVFYDQPKFCFFDCTFVFLQPHLQTESMPTCYVVQEQTEDMGLVVGTRAERERVVRKVMWKTSAESPEVRVSENISSDAC